ncbi:hypothetical protein ACFWPH_28710 [Nocardia sp. NPDC058499]|uniref:hypothetical protein n=1 Tax=Nocardia sp. NPDC058499 TaxID=3346530 RepID=UPI0036532D03
MTVTDADAYDPSILAMRVLTADLPYDDAVHLVVEHNPRSDPSMMVKSLDWHLTEKKRLYTFKRWTRFYDRTLVFMSSPETELKFGVMLLAATGFLAATLIGLAVTGHLVMSGVVLAATAISCAVIGLIAWRRRCLSLRYSDVFWTGRRRGTPS